MTIGASWVWLSSAVSGLILCFAAWRYGAAPERICAAVLPAMNIADRLYHLLVQRGAHYGQVDLGHFAIDAVAAGVFVAIAMRANRFYPLCLSALQLYSVVAHFSRWADPSEWGQAYYLMAYGPYVFLIAALAIGIACHARRVRKYGPYRSWRGSWSRLPERARSRSPNA